MKNDVVQLVLYLFVLVIGAAAEELLPKFLGVGFPLLMAAALAIAISRRRTVALLFALAAGAVEDALSGLPPVTTSSFLVLAGALSRRVWMRPTATILVAIAYPVYQLWLVPWIGGSGRVALVRLALSVPIGLATGLTVSKVLRWAEGKAAVDEA